MVAQRGCDPYREVQRSLCLPLTMNGKTQLPHSDPPVMLLEDPMVVVGAEVVTLLSEQIADSSPSEAKANLLPEMTAALLEIPGSPVTVPVTG